MNRISIALAVLLLLSGCGSAIRVTEPTVPPRTLEEVNARLATTPRAIVWLADGARVRDAEQVRVGREEVRFVVSGEPLALSTDHVERVTTDGGTRAAAWSRAGATPGLALAGLSLLGLASAGEVEGAGAIVVVLGLYGGIGSAFVGAFMGGAAGSQIPSGASEVVYQAPLGRYLADR